MQRKERFQHFLDYFTTRFPEPQTELAYDSPYQLLVAVILSAQCTDKRVNLVTPPLFARFPTPESLAAAEIDEIYSFIRSISYPNNKAKHLSGMARLLVEEFASEVPASAEELQQMPGVGRKTANVILSVVFNQPAMAVDTHVFRVSRRLGLVPQTAKTPLAVEQHLMARLPQEVVAKAHHWLILHGRYVCLARRPHCEVCPLTHFCWYYQKYGPATPAVAEASSEQS